MGILTLWVVATFNFFFLYSDAGVVSIMTPPEIVQMLRQSYGYGASRFVRYVMYLRNMFSFGIVPPYFGWSTYHNEFVAEGLARTLPVTLMLIGTSLVIMITVGVIIGAIVASRRGTKLDVALTASSIITWCIPTFVVQMFTIVLLLKILWDNGIRVISLSFSYPTLVGQPDFVWWLIVYSRLLLPIFTLVITGLAYWVLMTRNLLLETLTEDYIVTARAKGLSESRVVFKHGFKSIYPQIVTMIALSLPGLITGSIVTEWIFGIDGIGRYFFYTVRTAEGIQITFLDSAALQAVIFVFTTLIVLFNIAADLIYNFMDPRIRMGARPRAH
jgi:peptide/nickel transport system permease protein